MSFAKLSPPPRYLVLDTESVPDGRLLAQVRYPREELSPREAIERAQADARAQSSSGSDFLPVTFHVPVAVCILSVGEDFLPQAIHLLDAPHYRPASMTESFWSDFDTCCQRRERVELVTFNGRGFDLPLLEMAAFRFGVAAPHHFASREPGRGQLDLMHWLTTAGTFRMAGGLNLLSKILGKPGKMETTGTKIYPLYLEGRLQDIGDYCLFDTLDTYFVFLRTRVLTGALSLSRERDIVQSVKTWLGKQAQEFAGLAKYLENWGDWQP
jgi:predicted PolB exonuclease-like 3'-5' exonuclease